MTQSNNFFSFFYSFFYPLFYLHLSDMETPCPKRPITPFFRFRKEVYPEVKAENPRMKQVLISKLIAERWQSLSPNERNIYHEQYVDENARYLKDLALWKGSYQNLISEKDSDETKSSPLKQPQELSLLRRDERKPPKRPKTAFLRFMNEVLLDLKEASPRLRQTELTKIAAGMWNELSSEQKKPYHDAFWSENERYLVEYAAWKGKYARDNEPKEGNGEFDDDDINPPKRPRTAFLRFLGGVYAELKEKNPGVKSTELPKFASKMWRELPSEQKQPYHDAYWAENEKYLVEYAAWKKKYGSDEEDEEPPYSEARTPIWSEEEIASEEEIVPEENIPQQRPKQPDSAYFRFLKEVYSSIRSQYPLESQKKAVERITFMWKEMDDIQREPYYESFRIEREQYEDDLATWKKKNQKKKKSLCPKKSRAPKKQPITPFCIFAKESRQRIRKEFPEMGFREVDKQLRREWKELPKRVKREYIARGSRSVVVRKGRGKRIQMVVDEEDEEEEGIMEEE